MPSAHQSEIRAFRQPQCLLCGSEGEPLHSGLKDRIFGAPGEWNLSECSNPECGLVWLDPMPIEEDISKAYENYYTHDEVPQIRTLASRIFFSLLGLEATRKRLDYFFIDSQAPGRLLEIGFGDARRLQQFVDLGWDVVGQEVDRIAYERAESKGFKVYRDEITQIGFEANQFDAIVGSHVIEHVHDPLRLLRECRRLLKPGGRLVMLTPNTASYGHRRFGRDWRGNEPPRHLHLFAPHNMRSILQLVGFKCMEIKTTPARAAGMYLGCLDIALQNNSLSPVAKLLGRSASAAMYTVFARTHHLINPLAADEMVITAWH